MNANSTMLAAMLIAALVAGAFGGVAASTIFDAPVKGPQQSAVTPTPTGDTTADSDEGTTGTTVDLAAELAIRDALLVAADVEIKALQTRLDLLEGDTTRTLGQRIAELEKRVADGGAPSASVDGGNGPSSAAGGTAALSPDDPAFREALDRAMEERDAARQERENASRQERMTQMMTQQTESILAKLAEEIAMTEDQKAAISIVLQQRNKARTDVVARGMAARQNNEEFDWRGEMEPIETGAMESIRMELDASQQATFESLTAENGLDGLGGGFGMMGGRRR